MPDSQMPLEPSSVERRRLAEAAVDYLDSFIERRSDSPASFERPDGSLLSGLRRGPPEHGGPIGPLLETIEAATRSGIDTASGAHLSYIPNGGLYTAAIGEFLAAGINRYTGGSHGAPGAIAIEQSVVDWMLALFDLGGEAAGVLLSGGSLANLTALVAARARFGERFWEGTVYTSERAHHSVEKSARLAGIPEERIRRVGVDPDLRLDVEALEAAIGADERSGSRPLAIVGTAGTTDTGTIDPLPELAGVAERHGAWFHVDAAYGGFFRLTARGSARLAGIELADSITVDAHKSLFMPYGVGGLLVRDGRALVAAHEGRGAYMQDVPDWLDVPNYFSLGPELTRPFRGLPVWLALHVHGEAAFRRELDRMLDLAEAARLALGNLPRVEVVTEPDLSVVAFWSARGDADSRRLFEHLNSSGKIHISSTTIGGRFVLRLAFLSHRTTNATVDIVLDLLRAAPG